MSETARGLALLRRNLENLARAPLALRAVDARFGKGVARRGALRRLAFFPRSASASTASRKTPIPRCC